MRGEASAGIAGQIEGGMEIMAESLLRKLEVD
jgi:hypothetical protein